MRAAEMRFLVLVLRLMNVRARRLYGCTNALWGKHEKQGDC